jgi:hypothetical protein
LHVFSQADADDMTWTFPITDVPLVAPPVPLLRQFVGQALQALARNVRAGGCPAVIGPTPVAPTAGWDHWHPWPEMFLQVAGTSRFQTPLGELAVASGNCLLMPPLLAVRQQLLADAAVAGAQRVQ